MLSRSKHAGGSHAAGAGHRYARACAATLLMHARATIGLLIGACNPMLLCPCPKSGLQVSDMKLELYRTLTQVLVRYILYFSWLGLDFHRLLPSATVPRPARHPLVLAWY